VIRLSEISFMAILLGLWKSLTQLLRFREQESLNRYQKNLFSRPVKVIISYIGRYFYDTNKKVLACVTILTANLIYINYHWNLDTVIGSYRSFTVSLTSRFVLFLIALGLPYLLYALLTKKDYFKKPLFITSVAVAAMIFSLKIALHIPLQLIFPNDNPWSHIIHWPLLLLITGTLLFIWWRVFDRDQPFYGLTVKGLNWKPYLIMLLVMVPLIAAASTQPDFLAVYPKLKMLYENDVQPSWWHKLLFELSYGSDFVTIELFFRGFLILAFIKWAGKDAILPMACFYCTIHFGKPLGECISSYFGGLLLGIVVYHTRSIYGGLMVHLGIAWLMELGGYIGGNLK
jgi:hypothetical protein